MLHRFGMYLTKDVKNAAWVALLLGLMSLLGLPIFWIASVIFALTVLHAQDKAGLFVFGVLLVPGVIIAFLGSSLDAAIMIAQVCMIGLFAAMLQRDVSWAVVLISAALVGALGIIGFHLWVGDPGQWWVSKITESWQQAGISSFMGNSLEESQVAITKVSHYITGIFALSLSLYTIWVLLLARWWQASLFNPGGLKKEFLAISMPKIASSVLLVCIAAALMRMPLAQDLLLVLALPFVFTGISLVHTFAGRRKEVKTPILVLFYLLLLFPLVSLYVAIVLVLVSIIDSFRPFRSSKSDHIVS
jgi:hypothetical protein